MSIDQAQRIETKTDEARQILPRFIFAALLPVQVDDHATRAESCADVFLHTRVRMIGLISIEISRFGTLQRVKHLVEPLAGQPAEKFNSMYAIAGGHISLPPFLDG